MLIDRDFDKETERGGIDNQFEIKWDNKVKKWTQILEAWSSNGQQKNLPIKDDNHIKFFKWEKRLCWAIIKFKFNSLPYKI